MQGEEVLGAAEREAVERVLSEATGRGVRLEAVAQIRPDDARVLRVSAADGSWIVKRAGEREESALYGTWGFFSEWVAAATVADVAPDIAPAFLGGDGDELLMVFADVGTGRDVSEVLRADDPDEARRALVAMGAALGRLHAATSSVDVQDAHALRWRERGGARHPVPRITLPFSSLAESLNHTLEEAGVDARVGGSDIDELHAWGLERGDGWSLIHGDPCLDNWILDAAGRPVLIDFQGATFAPAALDAAYARAPFPTCWCLRRLPPDAVEDFESAHRDALAGTDPALPLGRPETHRRHVAMATAFWCAVQLLWRLEAASAPVPPPAGSHLGFPLVPVREAVLLRCDTFLERSEACGGLLPSFAEQVQALRDELVGRRGWTEPDVDLYPAFGGRP